MSENDAGRGAFATCAAARHWAATTGGKKTFGVCVPLFSLKSDRQVGMGDFADLHGMVDFCADNGFGLLQLLPLNDAGLDGVPYSAVSAFALDPAFIAPDLIGVTGRDWDDALRATRERFAGAQRIDNPAVRRARLELLRMAWERMARGPIEAAIDEFCRSNDWAPIYAAYKVLKDANGQASWENWPDGQGNLAPDQAVERFGRGPEARFHLFCQYEADRQMKAAHDHAGQRGVLLEGDIPILVARDSADVWAHRWMFRMEFAAGAPPDMYSSDGQTWGFPTYDWPAIESDGYGWWRRRLRSAARYFDCYRIDHVVGFFRIWTVHRDAQNGREGWFEPWDEAVWGAHGRKILDMMLESTDMLPLAEDLGTIPHICRSTLRQMGICGLKVQRWEKRWETDRRFIELSNYEPFSVATLSTHDCEIVADWWLTTDQSERDELWALVGPGQPAPACLDGDAGRALIRWFGGAFSAFVVLALQDILHPFGVLPGEPAIHRINLPGTVGAHNWSWRCPVPIERLADVPGLREFCLSLV